MNVIHSHYFALKQMDSDECCLYTIYIISVQSVLTVILSVRTGSLSLSLVNSSFKKCCHVIMTKTGQHTENGCTVESGLKKKI